MPFTSSLPDKYLHPIRQQICDLIPENSSVIDIGCGHGAQLFLLSPKIKYGLGIDKKDFTKLPTPKNLEFQVLDINQINQTFDYAILSMVLHTLNSKERKDILQNIPAKNLIIADYQKSPSTIRNFLAHFEELFSDHYKNFKNYFNQTNFSTLKQISTKDSAIKIWTSLHQKELSPLFQINKLI